MKPKGEIQIFLAHASEDKDRVRELYRKLKNEGYKPWLDKLDLMPGIQWKNEIPRAIRNSTLFIACLSATSVQKRGYVQSEFRLALRQAADIPANEIYIIPLKFDECQIPDLEQADYGVKLSDYQGLDYWEEGAFDRLVAAIEYRRGQLEVLAKEPVDRHKIEIAEQYREADKKINTSSFHESTALEIWNKKLEYFRLEEAKTADPVRKFEMQQRIAECLQKIKELENPIQRWEFDVITVDRQGREIKRARQSAEFIAIELGNGISLEMVKIPGGTFQMGSAEGEGRDSEHPQHPVTIPSFLMGKYAVTQAQWRAVVALPQVEISLNPDPSYFKGDNRPVETISWYEAIEFCQRLSRLTGHLYRLPSEAEWEYACRAGTTTPFHFGQTITAELANYDANYTFAEEPKGNYREQTTPVGQFSPNAFGLYDTHGNVWEWCADHGHENYQDAPKDEKPWITGGRAEVRVSRGGSWNYYPAGCRSAVRYFSLPADRNFKFGFRVSRAVSPGLF